MNFKNTIMLALAVTTCNVAVAGNLSVEATAQTISHEFRGNYSVDYILGSYYGASDWPDFSTSLSEVGTMTFKILAPVGQHFEIVANPNSIARIFGSGSSSWSAPGASFGGVNKFLPTVLSFDSLVGTSPSQTGIYFQASADRKKINTGGSITSYTTGSMEFNAIVLTVNTSSLAAESLPVLTYKSNNFGFYLQDIFNQSFSDDPGASIRLVSSVPEPSGYLLLIAGLGALSCIIKARKRTVARNSESNTEA